jgi:hypothetical protein
MYLQVPRAMGGLRKVILVQGRPCREQSSGCSGSGAREINYVSSKHFKIWWASRRGCTGQPSSREALPFWEERSDQKFSSWWLTHWVNASHWGFAIVVVSKSCRPRRSCRPQLQEARSTASHPRQVRAPSLRGGISATVTSIFATPSRAVDGIPCKHSNPRTGFPSLVMIVGSVVASLPRFHR